MSIRKLGPVLAAGALAACALAAAAAALAAAALAAGGGVSLAHTARTRVAIYHAFTASGAPTFHVRSTVHGTCNGGSAAIDRDDAWRCFAGNFVYDPCFSSSRAKGIVLCPASAFSSYGVEIKLSSKLTDPDRRKPSTSGDPWAVETTSGAKCEIDTGATTVLDGRRANYFCAKGKDVLWGSPTRTTEPWTIYAAPATATKLTRKIKLSVAWF
jgi:hypothetical protein